MIRIGFALCCGILGLLASFSSTRADDKSKSQWEKRLPKSETAVELFNGTDLTGWNGDSKYWSVHEGAIRGTNTEPVATSTYLFTEKKYRNFRLIVEVKQNLKPGYSNMHSAVAILGEQFTDKGDNQFGFKGPLIMFGGGEWGLYDAYGRNRVIPDGFGPQIEKKGDWNLLEILVTENRIRYVANGVPLYDFTDDAKNLKESPLGLQLHSNSRPQEVLFKNFVFTENPENRLITPTQWLEHPVAQTSIETGAEVPEDVKDPFAVPPGFVVEKLFTVPKEELGSWVGVTTDPKGRILASDQGSLGIVRITPPAPGSNEPTKVEQLNLGLSAAQGMLFAFDHLYVSSNGHGNGLHRVKYDEMTDTFGKPEKLADFRGWGEHGPHALRLSPDGKSIYVVAGNHVKPPFDPIPNNPPQTLGGMRTSVLKAHPPENMYSRIQTNWDEDSLTRRLWDGNGHARGILAPAGWIAKIDPDAKSWEIISMGYRNQYDMDFNAEGELFAYDADMEWDMGMPWYRPTRVVHATSGSDIGWRSGSPKFPSYYPDALPIVADMGPGSPVGVEFGYKARFPGKYQKALYCLDWTFGTIYALHLKPDGSTYVADKEEFLSRNALPLTDITTGHDGAFYFAIGGRGIQSELYRVRYAGDESTEPVDASDAEGKELRILRRQIESTHSVSADQLTPNWRELAGDESLKFGTPEANAAKKKILVKHLGHPDRFISYAARVGIEFLPVEEWQNEIFSSQDAQTQIIGAVALARQGDTAQKAPLLKMLLDLDLSQLNEEQQLGYLRAVQLAFIRLGEPDDAVKAAFVEKLDPLYPSESLSMNRELIQVLVAAQSPTVVSKTIALMQVPSGETESDLGALLGRNQSYGEVIREVLANQPDKQRIYYAYALRDAKTGWTIEDRKAFFAFMQQARQWKGANSYMKNLDNIDNEAFENLTADERIVVESAGLRVPFAVPELPQPAGPGKERTIQDVLALAEEGLRGGRDFKNGEKMYAATRCIVCHRFAGTGGSTGPDLTQLAGRFNTEALAEAIIDPNKAVSDQYRAYNIITVEGRVISGRIVSETTDRLIVVTDPEDSTKVVELNREDVDEMQESASSLMPAGLLNSLNDNEVLDLFAYLLSRGNPEDRMFKPVQK